MSPHFYFILLAFFFLMKAQTDARFNQLMNYVPVIAAQQMHKLLRPRRNPI